jgi:hypothetical protein
LLPSIYPNPFKGVINIKIPLQTQLKLRVFSMEGKRIDQFVLGGYESKTLEIYYKGNIGIRIEGNLSCHDILNASLSAVPQLRDSLLLQNSEESIVTDNYNLE